jgi:hypothetical protein
MATLPLRQLGMTGIQKDINANDVPATGLIEARNVRIKDQSIQALSDVTSPIVVSATETLLFAEGIYRDKNLLSGIIVVLSDSSVGDQIFVYFYDTSGARTDISPTIPFTVGTEQWFGFHASVFFILTNGVDIPHSWVHGTGGQIFSPMPGWPANYRCDFMVSYKNFLVAGGLTIDGTPSPGIVKWSHPVSPGDVTTFWDITDPTILAGENAIVDTLRVMVSLHPFKDLCMIYFDRIVWRMTFSGGQSVFNFERAFADDGAVSARSMVEVDGLAYVFGHNEVYRHDGYQKKSITDLRLTRFIANSFDPSQNVDAVYYPINNEIIWLVRTPGIASTIDGDQLYIYNLAVDAWTNADVSKNNDGSIGILFRGPIIVGGAITDTWETYAPTGGDKWSEAGQLSWQGTFVNVEDDTLYAMSSQAKTIYNFDAPLGESLYRENALISHTKIDLDEAGDSVGDRIVYVNRIFPQIVGSGVVEFRFGVSTSANSPVEWQETCLFKISKADVNDPNESAEDYACDIRVAGRYLAYEMRPIDGSFFAISGMDVEIDTAGEK